MIEEKFFTWNKSVPNYDEFQDIFAECFTKGSEKELKVLELGVGKGGTAVAFLKKFPNTQYFGLDNSKEAVERCKDALKNNSNTKIEFADFLKFETEDKFDAVVANLSIHHIENEDKQKLLKKIKNWLKEGGIFVWGDLVKLEDKNMNNEAVKIFKNFRERVLDEKEKQKIKEHIQNDKHIFNTIKEMKNMLKEVGFVKIDLIWDYYSLVIIRAV